jgi:hypothetical protein
MSNIKREVRHNDKTNTTYYANFQESEFAPDNTDLNVKEFGTEYIDGGYTRTFYSYDIIDDLDEIETKYIYVDVKDEE